jgi:hypothetical protein
MVVLFVEVGDSRSRWSQEFNFRPSQFDVLREIFIFSSMILSLLILETGKKFEGF